MTLSQVNILIIEFQYNWCLLCVYFNFLHLKIFFWEGVSRLHQTAKSTKKILDLGVWFLPTDVQGHK